MHLYNKYFDYSNILELLKEKEKHEIIFKPNPGNGGDALIAYATMKMFDDHGIHYKIANDDVDVTNKILVYGGGGNLVGYYSTAYDYLSRVYPKVKELIILPHTIFDNDELLNKFGTNTTIFCRESKSYNYVKSFSKIGKVELANDMAFSIDTKHVLSIEKKSFLEQKTVYKYLLKQFFVEGSFKKKVFNGFRYDYEASTIDKPKNNFDLSNAILFDRNMLDKKLVYKNASIFFNVLNHFNEINTNRLHIGVASLLLDKKVNLYPNSYWKIEEVYNKSISNNFNNVVWKG